MLKGEKVVLRAISREDLPRLWEFNNDLEVEILGGGDPPMPQTYARLQAEFEQDASRGGRDGARFAIEADGKFIGQCGLFAIDEAARTSELGIGIGDRDYWGKGYGRDAINVLLDYAFRVRNFRKVWLRTNGDNPRAIRAYAACGFVEEGRLRAHVWSNGSYVDTVCMSIFRDDWHPAK